MNISTSVRYMGRFRTNRFNPWTNLHKMLNQNKPKVVEEEVQVVTSKVSKFVEFFVKYYSNNLTCRAFGKEEIFLYF